jgi:hypothetical protein
MRSLCGAAATLDEDEEATADMTLARFANVPDEAEDADDV